MARAPVRVDPFHRPARVRTKRHRVGLALAAAWAMVAGCGGGSDDPPAQGEGTDVNTDIGEDPTTTGDPREASDGNSGADDGTPPGEDSDAGQDDGGQGQPPAPGG